LELTLRPALRESGSSVWDTSADCIGRWGWCHWWLVEADSQRGSPVVWGAPIGHARLRVVEAVRISSVAAPGGAGGASAPLTEKAHPTRRGPAARRDSFQGRPSSAELIAPPPGTLARPVAGRVVVPHFPRQRHRESCARAAVARSNSTNHWLDGLSNAEARWENDT